ADVYGVHDEPRQTKRPEPELAPPTRGYGKHLMRCGFGPTAAPLAGAEMPPEARRSTPATIPGRPRRDHLHTRRTAPARGRILRRDLPGDATNPRRRRERLAQAGLG